MSNLTKILVAIYVVIMMIAVACKKDEPTPTQPVTTPTTTPPAVTKSTAKDLTKFSFAALSPVVDATIDASTKAITATVPVGTDITKLVPTITISDKSTISPATGVAQDFSKEVSYTVTAEDASTVVWKVNVKVPTVLTKTIDCNSAIPDIWEDLGEGVDYVVKCNLRIEKDIVIKPGVKIQFEAGTGFRVYSGANFSLNMVGTKEKPIVLEGKTAVAGAWKGLEFSQNKSLKNQWEYVTIRHAGDGQTAGVEIGDSNVGIKNCEFSDNKGFGIALTDQNTIFKAFESNVFAKNTKSALKLFYSQIGYLDSKSTYLNNTQKYIEVLASRTEEAIIVQKLDVPYRITNDIDLRASLTLNAGVTFEFVSDVSLYNQYVKSAAFIANGTATDPIRLIGAVPNTKGVWAGISLLNNNVESKLNYCIIDGAGSRAETTNFNFWFEKTATAAITIDGTGYKESYRATVTNCSISNSGGYGIAYSIYSKNAVTIKDNTFKDNTKANIIEFPY